MKKLLLLLSLLISFCATAQQDITAKRIKADSIRTAYINAKVLQGLFNTDKNFEGIVIPDTQLETKLHPADLKSQMQWVKDSAAFFNIGFVMQVGDITNNCTLAEWDTASKYYGYILDSTNIPFLFIPGNHDYANGFNPASRQDTFYNQHFTQARLSAKPYYGGQYLANQQDNWWIKFNVGSQKYAAIGLEFMPRDAVLDWAKHITDSIYLADPVRDVIVITHGYIDVYGELPTDTSAWAASAYGMTADNSGQEMWDKYIKKCPNIKFVFGGHYLIPNLTPGVGLTAHIIGVGEQGNLVNQFFVNYQDNFPNFGDGYIMRMKFRPSQNNFTTTYYSTAEKHYDTRSETGIDSFVLDYNNTQILTSPSIRGSVVVNGSVRAVGGVRDETLTKSDIPFIGIDHKLVTNDSLGYDLFGFKLISRRDSAAIRIQMGDTAVAKAKTPVIGISNQYWKLAQLRLHRYNATYETSIYFGDSSGISSLSRPGSSDGVNNTGYGAKTFTKLTTAVDNVGIGTEALKENTTGSFNTATGQAALRAVTTGEDNTATGQAAGVKITTGSRNSIQGSNSLQNCTTCSDNLAIGKGTIGTATVADSNTALGVRAARFSGTVRRSVLIGFHVEYNTPTIVNRFVVDNDGTDANPPLLEGDFNTGQQLKVNGNFNLTGIGRSSSVSDGDSSDALITSGWVRRQLFGTGSGGGVTDTTKILPKGSGIRLVYATPGSGPTVADTIWDKTIAEGWGIKISMGADSTITIRVDTAALKVATKSDLTLYQLLDADLTAIAALSPSNDDIIQRKSGAWTNRTLAQLKTDLSLNNVDNTSDATKNAASVTLTNKTITAPVIATIVNTGTLTLPTVTGTLIQYSESTTASSSTPSPTGDARSNFFDVTALAANATFAAPSGTVANHNSLRIRVKDNGTARTLSWNAIYRGSTDFALPNTTVISKTMYIDFMYNSADSKWDAVGLTQGF